MSFEVRRWADTLIRVLPLIGQNDNAESLAEESRYGDIARFFAGPFGRVLLAEVAGGLETAAALSEPGTRLFLEVRNARRAVDGLDDLAGRTRPANTNARPTPRTPSAARLPRAA